jgi:hypothetical protein
MKANELRIGNLVLDDTSENIMIVSRIESVDYTEWNSGDQYNICCLQFGTRETYYDGNFKPIPLTEEWLLKFDFEITNNFQTKDRFQTHIQDGIIWFEYGYIVIELKYVHQLQNLYFALIGEELTFKQQEQ